MDHHRSYGLYMHGKLARTNDSSTRYHKLVDAWVDSTLLDERKTFSMHVLWWNLHST